MDVREANLVPVPRGIEPYPGEFRFRSGAYVAIDWARPQMLFPTAKRLRAALLSATGTDVQVVVGQVGEPSDVGVLLTIDDREVAERQGYVLDVDVKRVSITGHDAAGVFYGVCTLEQLIRQYGAVIPCMTITDYPDFVARGVMLDVSRCKVPTLETLKGLVELLASLKVNQFQLYTEHTFAYREHREAWQDSSPITGEDILELDAYCRERFVQLVPNQNSFGHLRPWLRHPKYRHLAEAPDGFDLPWGGHADEPFSLNPTDPRSLDLLRSMYDDLLPHFSSRLFNVGCDETWDLGSGRSKAACEEKGTNRVYLDFLLEIHKLVEEQGRTMMFWGDIILHEPELISELPPDVIALEWGYEHDHDFAGRCKAFADAGVPFFVCPGTSTWNAVVGRTDNAMGNLRSAAENGLKYGAVGYLNTDWGDNGHWQYLSASYLGYVYGAAVSWAFEANKGIDLPTALSQHAFGDPTGRMGQLAFDLGNVYRVYERVTAQRIHNASFLVGILYQPIEELESGRVNWEVVSPTVFVEARREIDAAMGLLPHVQVSDREGVLVRREYENAARLLRHACALGELKIGLAALRPDVAAQRAALARQATALVEDMRRILAEHRSLWLARNRPGGLEHGSGRHFHGMIDTYQRIAQEMSQ